MERVSIPYAKLPGTGKLAADFFEHYDRVAAFYAGNPPAVETCLEAACRIHFPEQRRAALVEALRTQNPASRSLDRLAKPGTVAVVTGQQVGLFSGPCYGIYKALTAVKLAARLTAGGIEAVPVFWMATEDHDFAEVSRCWSFDDSHTPVPLRIETPREAGQPVGGIRLSNPPLNELRTSLGSLDFGDEIATLAEAAYAPGKTLGDAFRNLLRRLLPPELLYLDPLDPSLRALAAPLFREVLAAAPELNRRLLERNSELEAAGYPTQVRIDEQTSLLFLLRREGRIPLRRNAGGGYVAAETGFTTGELREHAGRLSPNALLRPVVQDYILPTVTYVAGPAEIAYLAQSEVLYRTLGVRMPVAFPRAGFTLLDARAARLMQRYGLSLEAFFNGAESIKAGIAWQLVPPEVGDMLRKTGEQADTLIQALQEQLTGFDPTLAAAADRSRSKILHQFAELERKVTREAMRRDERASAEAGYLSNLIYPRGRLQERFYTILPFLAKNGLAFVDRLYENIDLEHPGHLVLTS